MKNGRIPTDRSDKQNETGKESKNTGKTSEEWGKAHTTYFRDKLWGVTESTTNFTFSVSHEQSAVAPNISKAVNRREKHSLTDFQTTASVILLLHNRSIQKKLILSNLN